MSMNEQEEERYFDHFSRPDPPPLIDPEPRLRGDILIYQVYNAWTPEIIKEILRVTWGLGILVVEVTKCLGQCGTEGFLRRWRKGRT